MVQVNGDKKMLAGSLDRLKSPPKKRSFKKATLLYAGLWITGGANALISNITI